MKGRPGNKYWATEKYEAEEPIKISDGSYVYDKKMREKKVVDINSDARSFALAKPMYSLREFTNLDQPTMQLLNSFIEYLQKNEIPMMMFLSPYHPKVYEVIKSSTEYLMVAESEKWYRNLAVKHGINILGSFDPKTLNLGDSDFYDGMHLNDQSVRRIFATITR
jgi:hypothetical protein